jgi:uncharacterized protein
MKQITIAISFAVLFSGTVCAGLPAIKITPEWKAEIKGVVPGAPTARPKAKRKVLLFSLMTGFKHWVTPHTAEVLKIMAEKTGAFEIVESNDVTMFAPDKIKAFDAVILNNTCSKGPGRNIFIDALGKDRSDEAAALEKSVIDFVADGGGLVAIHGAIVFLNNSREFGEVLGGAFAFHPAQQEVTVNLVDPEHPLVKAFGGKPLVHVDEPYLFKGAYESKNFRPLLVMDTDKLNCGKRQKDVQADVRYVSWIKKHGKGRVFYCSPSHNAQSFSNPKLLQFMLDGIQYALGDLPCDDSPMAGVTQ